MGLVTEHLIKMIKNQVERHSVVVWFDPEDHYPHVVNNLAIPDVKVFRYEQRLGFLALRREIEPLWGHQTPPKLLIYVSLDMDDTHHALIEYTVAGVVVRPGQQPPERNTRLSVVARRAIEGVCPGAVIDQYVADADAGKLDLFELDTLAESCSESQIGALSLIFASSNPEEIVLCFLADTSFDDAILEKDAIGDLTILFTNIFGSNFQKEIRDLPSLRATLTRFILGAELRETLWGDLPEKLLALPSPKSKAARESVLRIVQLWRQRNDLVACYLQAAGKVEAEFALGGIAWTLEAIRNCLTFARLEAQLQTLVEERLVMTQDETLIHLADERINGFWATQKPEIKLRWEIISKAGKVLLTSSRMRNSLKARKASTGTLVERYASGKKAWCQLDTTFRHLDRDFHYFDLDEDVHDGLIRLVAAARQSYIRVVDNLNSKFVHSYEEAGFEIPGVVQQVDIFHDFVAPSVQESQTAYFLVDALRFEMAKELEEQFLEEWDTNLTPAIATPPTITEIGMASLMPGAELGLTVVSVGAGKLAGVISGETLKNRVDRVKYLQKKSPSPVEIIRLNQIVPIKGKKLRSNLKKASLIVITASDEIDGLWENSPEIARQMQDYVFDQLRRGIKNLFGLGINRVIITADHGYLSGDRLMPGEAMDPPGGKTEDLHRRVWVGKGGVKFSNCIRKPLSAFGISGDFELVTPYGLAYFKVPGGSMDYFHGGLSLQELVIPVLVVTPGKGQPFIGSPAFIWEIKPGSQKITSPFFSVNIEGMAEEWFQTQPRIRIELRVGDQIISQPIAASYGYNEITRDVTLNFDQQEARKLVPNTVTLHITEIPKTQSVTLYLLDSETGISLSPSIILPIEILT